MHLQFGAVQKYVDIFMSNLQGGRIFLENIASIMIQAPSKSFNIWVSALRVLLFAR